MTKDYFPLLVLDVLKYVVAFVICLPILMMYGVFLLLVWATETIFGPIR